MNSLRALVPTFIRHLVARMLPLPSRLDNSTVADVQSHSIRDGISLHVYWLKPPSGPGTGASLMVFGDEVMRFDCLGPEKGHWHLNMEQTRGFPGNEKRLYYREQTIEEQIERSCFELEHNLAYALDTNISKKIRKLQIRPTELEKAVHFLRATSRSTLSRHLAAPEGDLANTPPVSRVTPETQ